VNPVDDHTLAQTQEILGYSFDDPELLRTALTHTSIADARVTSNERLEFLGDAVLGMLVCEYLFENFPDYLEGQLTKVKSAIVSRRMCTQIVYDLDLQDKLAIGKGMRTRGELPASLLAALLEAIIGAIYLDAGLERVRAFLMPLLETHIQRAARSGHQQNFKSVLQQFAQTEMHAQPEYVLLDEKGPDHAKCFEVRVEIGDRAYPARWAQTKKQAEQLAALACLNELDLVERDDDGTIIVAEPDMTAAD
jgi:ribonuclease III